MDTNQYTGMAALYLKGAIGEIMCPKGFSQFGKLRPDIYDWCVENLKEDWISVHSFSTDQIRVVFTSADDAALFRMTWND